MSKAEKPDRHSGATRPSRALDTKPKQDKPSGRPAFCIFINTLAEGLVPSVRDENDNPCVFATRAEAEREIADNVMTRIQEYMDGDRDFDDAMTIEEYVVEVDVFPDGWIVDADGNEFGSWRA